MSVFLRRRVVGQPGDGEERFVQLVQRNDDAVVEGDAVSESPRRFDSFEDGAAAARSGEEAPPVAGAVAEKVRNASDFGKFIPAFEYRLISLRDKNPESLLSYGDALGALFYLANPSKTEGFLEAAERLRIFLLGLSDEERELTTNHLRGYLRILMKKEGLEIDDALDLCLEREEADVIGSPTFGLRLGDPVQSTLRSSDAWRGCTPSRERCADEQIAYASGALSGSSTRARPPGRTKVAIPILNISTVSSRSSPVKKSRFPSHGAPRGAQRDDPRDLVLGERRGTVPVRREVAGRWEEGA